MRGQGDVGGTGVQAECARRDTSPGFDATGGAYAFSNTSMVRRGSGLDVSPTATDTEL